MKRKHRRMALRIEAMERRELLSGLAALPSTDHTPVAPGPHALIKLHGGAHPGVLPGGSHSGGAGSTVASPDEKEKGSQLFENFSKFSVSFNGMKYTADIAGPTTYVGNTGLTVTTKPFDNNAKSEVLDLNFQTTNPTIFQAGNGTKVTFGPIGIPTRIPLLKAAKLTDLFVYFTKNGKAVPNIIFKPGFFSRVGENPIPGMSGQVFFVKVDASNPTKELFVFNNNPFLNKVNVLGVPVDATGMHIDIVVTPK